MKKSQIMKSVLFLLVVILVLNFVSATDVGIGVGNLVVGDPDWVDDTPDDDSDDDDDNDNDRGEDNVRVSNPNNEINQIVEEINSEKIMLGMNIINGKDRYHVGPVKKVNSIDSRIIILGISSIILLIIFLIILSSVNKKNLERESYG